MLSRPTQSYITRTIIDFNFNTFPRKPHNYVVTAADTASSLQVAVKELLYELRDEEVGNVLGFAGSKKLDRVGDLVIKHHLTGCYVFEAAVIGRDNLPSGCKVRPLDVLALTR